MDLADAAPTAGIAGCLATLLALAAPYALISDPGTGLSVYYASGPVGAGGVGFLAVLLVVVFLSGKRGRTAPDTVAGVALVASLGLVALALLWALAVDPENVFSFPADAEWMTSHRWVVLACAAVVPLSAAAYARAVLRS
ncbi:DUF7548 family protein [Halorarum salinum]|uniref:Uncharacterized protein n=1 Tax=Halorarum salinum TaxID=2743089 RepID=A0A7D5QAL4_9EURY|nr:hypothetical protein [Halobaculum salinum]QLG62676.1 hypothetical protein HUG12_13445 [Halobaculum salinum]